MKKFYVMMSLHRWENMEVLTPARMPLGGCERSAGCLLVYDTLEALRADYPTAEYVEIEPKISEEKTNREAYPEIRIPSSPNKKKPNRPNNARRPRRRTA